MSKSNRSRQPKLSQTGSLMLKKREHKPTLYWSHEVWELFPKLFLTKNALNELNHLNRHLLNFELLPQFNLDICPEQLKSVCQLARDGGPDLTDLRGHPKPGEYAMESGDESQNNSSSMRTTSSDTGKATGPSYKNFETMLAASGVHFLHFANPDEKFSSVPLNLQEIKERANETRASANLIVDSDNLFYKFLTIIASFDAKPELTEYVVPILESGIQTQSQSSRDTRFKNLETLIEGGLDQRVLVMETPAKCYGASMESLNERVRKDLSHKVIPTHQPLNPIAPNFFLELKGDKSRVIEAKRQALYHGALGERGQIALRSWGHDEPVLDGIAHTIVCTYFYRMLSFYSIHAARSSDPSRRVEYFMHNIDTFFMDISVSNFSKAIAAYQNLLNYTEEKRNEAIELANARAREIRGAS